MCGRVCRLPGFRAVYGAQQLRKCLLTVLFYYLFLTCGDIQYFERQWLCIYKVFQTTTYSLPMELCPFNAVCLWLILYV